MGIKSDIIYTIECIRLRWYGHMRRMSDQRWPKKVLKWQTTKHIKGGRPRNSWREGVEEAMASEEDWTNGKLWRENYG